MKAAAIIHRPCGPRWNRVARRPIDIRRGRKLIRGSRTRFLGRPWIVLATGYERSAPVIHLGELR